MVYQCAGDLWMVDDLTPDSVPRKLDVRLGGPRAGRRGYQVPAASHVDGCPWTRRAGRAPCAYAAACTGSPTATARPAPSPTRPGVRVRLPEMLGSGGQVAYVTDAEGEDAIEIAYLPRASGDREPRRLAAGQLGRVQEMVADPDGERLAIASHDGRLLLIDRRRSRRRAPPGKRCATGAARTAGADRADDEPDQPEQPPPPEPTSTTEPLPTEPTAAPQPTTPPTATAASPPPPSPN